MKTYAHHKKTRSRLHMTKLYGVEVGVSRKKVELNLKFTYYSIGIIIHMYSFAFSLYCRVPIGSHCCPSSTRPVDRRTPECRFDATMADSATQYRCKAYLETREVVSQHESKHSEPQTLSLLTSVCCTLRAIHGDVSAVGPSATLVPKHRSLCFPR